jgi:chaperonin GroES
MFEVAAMVNFTKKGTSVMTLKPLTNRILARRIEGEKKTKGGLAIPDTAQEKPLEAKVIAVGPGKLYEPGKRIPMQVKQDDRILIGKYTGTEATIGGEELLIISEDEVLAVIG